MSENIVVAIIAFCGVVVAGALTAWASRPPAVRPPRPSKKRGPRGSQNATR
jgi:hypothetical protein